MHQVLCPAAFGSPFRKIVGIPHIKYYHCTAFIFFQYSFIFATRLTASGGNILFQNLNWFSDRLSFFSANRSNLSSWFENEYYLLVFRISKNYSFFEACGKCLERHIWCYFNCWSLELCQGCDPSQALFLAILFATFWTSSSLITGNSTKFIQTMGNFAVLTFCGNCSSLLYARLSSTFDIIG